MVNYWIINKQNEDKYMKLINKIAISLAMLALVGSANAATTLKVETHFGAATPSGEVATQFAKDVESNTKGNVKIEMFHSAAVTGKAAEVFNSARSGIIDCDMTGGAYQTGKNAAFQFAGDIMGGYETPYQQYDWLNKGGGREALNKLYNKYDMQFIGWWIPGQESLISSKPLRNVADLKDWKFRSPPGMETEIFADLGAKPIVMDFGEVPTALQTGIIDGADYSALANNVATGLYDTNPHASYPGFHSMPADHLACNKKKWDSLSASDQAGIQKAMDKAGKSITKLIEKKNKEAVKILKKQGVTLHDFSKADRATVRASAMKAWNNWKTKSPEAKSLIESHVAYMQKIGLIK
jgi:TRAP-type C4-dicarboxylate transport system substrate-binding protein